MGKQSRRKREKPSGRRDKPSSPPPGKAPCVLCDAPANVVGFWTPTTSYASFLGSKAIMYTLCERCVKLPGVAERVEMAIIGRHAEARGPVEQPPPLELDFGALARICEPGGLMTILGEEVPLVVPFEEGDDHKDFDRLVCAAGIKKFVRPVWGSDRKHTEDLARRLDEPSIVSFPTHILVEEMAPGVRKRTQIQHFAEGSLN